MNLALYGKTRDFVVPCLRGCLIISEDPRSLSLLDLYVSLGMKKSGETRMISHAFLHVRTRSQVYTIHKRFSSDKQDISRDISFFKIYLYDVSTSSVRTSGHMIYN